MNSLKQMVFPSHWTEFEHCDLRKAILLQPLFPLSLRKSVA